MLEHAFKEWAVICKALAAGQQAVILRKGGIAETTGDFAVEHTRFWLFPTYTHQQRAGIRPELVPLLDEAEAERPAANVVRLSHFAEVTGVFHVRSLTAALLLAHLHCWSDATVTQRFHYRTPGLFVLPVRVHRAAQVVELANDPVFDGCRSWVELPAPLSTAGATPVLSDADMSHVEHSLDVLLNPTAYA